jgi:hypothetical protein
MAARGWLTGGAGAIAGAVVLGLLVHPHVGSGRSCEGIGFGCTPERDLDTALVVAVYGGTAVATLVAARWRFLRGRPWRADLARLAERGASALGAGARGRQRGRADGRSTGSHRFEWASGDPGRAYGGSSGTTTAAAIGRWAERMRRRGVEVMIEDPGGDPTSDRRLRVHGSEIDEGGVLSVRASSYISELEITASTGCHRS